MSTNNDEQEGSTDSQTITVDEDRLVLAIVKTMRNALDTTGRNWQVHVFENGHTKIRVNQRNTRYPDVRCMIDVGLFVRQANIWEFPHRPYMEDDGATEEEIQEEEDRWRNALRDRLPTEISVPKHYDEVRFDVEYEGGDPGDV